MEAPTAVAPLGLENYEEINNVVRTVATSPLGNDTKCEENNQSWLSGVFVPVTYILIFVIGVIGNGLVIWLMVKKDHGGGAAYQRSVTNLYVLNLAVADFIFVGFLPFWTAVAFSGDSWLFGVVGCKLLSCVTLLNLYGSVFFLVGMGIDRYVAIVFALQAQNHRTRSKAIKACIFIWILATLVACQSLVLRKVSEEGEENCPTKFICYWYFYGSNQLRTAYFVVRSGLGFFIPFTVVVFCYIFIFVSLRRRNKRTAKNGMRIPENKISRLILWVIGMFVVCWLPNHVVNVVYAVAVSTQDSSFNFEPIKQAFFVTSCLAYTNSTCNPILYAFMKDDVKTQLVAMAAKYFGYRRSPTAVAFSEASSPYTKDTKDIEIHTRRFESSRRGEGQGYSTPDRLMVSPVTPQTKMSEGSLQLSPTPPVIETKMIVATTCGTVAITSETEAKTTLL